VEGRPKWRSVGHPERVRAVCAADANLHVTHEVGDDGIDYSKLTDQQLEQLEAILERARDQTDPSDGVVEGRAVPHEASASGLGKPEASNCIPRTEREDDDAQKSHLQG
jgi:hypothetical protein